METAAACPAARAGRDTGDRAWPKWLMYLRCPHCTGEVVLAVEQTDDGGADIYGPRSYLVAVINDVENVDTHDPDCPGLTDEEREVIEQQATDIANDPAEYEPPGLD